MDIVQKDYKIEPAKNSIHPELIFSVVVQTNKEQEIASFQSGNLMVNNKKIAELTLLVQTTQNIWDYAYSYDSALYSNIPENDKKKSNDYKFSAVLSKQAIDFIENERQKDLKKDAHFQMQFNFQCFYSGSGIVDGVNKSVHIGGPKTLDRNFDKFLVLSSVISYGQLNVTIPRSEWVHHFTEPLSIGKFLVLELNLPTNNKKITKEWKENIERSLSSISEIEGLINEGKWYAAIEAARKVSELFKFKLNNGKNVIEAKNKEKFKKLFADVNHSDKGFDELCSLIENLFNYISKFEHEKDQQGELLPKPIPQKEDAYFVYAICVALINMVTHKIK